MMKLKEDVDMESSTVRRDNQCSSIRALAAKEQCLSILDSNAVTSIMTVITIYALFSDDLRILTVDASGDVIYTALSSLSFFFFMFEILLQCWCRNQYMRVPDMNKLKNIRHALSFKEAINTFRDALAIGSFYFWLDILATISMTLEIPWMSQQQDSGSNGSFENARAGRASRAGARAARVIKVVRMIRLVRLVKLYKYMGDGNQKKRNTNTVAPDDSAYLSDNMPPESHVGAEMSDRTTKKVIIGILVMLIGIPLLQIDEIQFSNEFGMQMVFERRQYLSTFTGTDEVAVAAQKQALESWQFSEDLFINTSTCLSLKYDGFEDSGHKIATIPAERANPDTLQGPEKVAVIIVSDGDEDWHNMESDGVDTGRHVVKHQIAAVFDISTRAREEAVLGILLTTFVISLLAIGTMTFSRDVNTLVIVPIERMVQLVRDISANPLGKNFSLGPNETQEMNDDMETTLLLRTISKIAGLMRVGFGEAGAEIIGRNLNASYGEDKDDEQEYRESSVKVLGKGTKIQSIFAFCDVRNFTDTTECLQEEVMLFVNRIAHILHSIVVQCDGAANKNIGDAFLLTWKLDDTKSGGTDTNLSADKALFSLLKTMVEMSRHEDFICNFSPAALGALYERMPRYKCRIGCGLHVGWAVEGAIGSDKKIDASYISPHVNWSEFLEGSTKDYGVSVLMSQPFHDLLSLTAKKYCRQVDKIQKSTNDETTSLYTYETDLTQEYCKPMRLDDRRSRKQTARKRMATTQTQQQKKRGYRRMVVNGGKDATRVNAFENGNGGSSMGVGLIDGLGEAPSIAINTVTADVWDQDEDMVKLRIKFSDEKRQIWEDGMESYVKGNWSRAQGRFETILSMSNGIDGPASRLLHRIKNRGGLAPTDWSGYWMIDST